MTTSTAIQRAQAFRRLHAPGQILLLPNAWDAGSARVIEASGALAIATTSAGVAWAHGYPDGNALPTAVLTAAVAEIVVPELPPVATLRELGVRRLSAGSGIAQAAYGLARRAAAQLLEEGRYDTVLEPAIAYGEMNALFR